MIHLLQTAMPPSNLSFLIAAFVVTGLVFVAYVFFIFRRRQEARAQIEQLTRTAAAEDAPTENR